MPSKLKDYPRKVQQAIKREAKRRGLSVEKVIANATNLSSGRSAVYRA